MSPETMGMTMGSDWALSDAHLAEQLAGGAGELLLELRSDAGQLLGTPELRYLADQRAREYLTAQLQDRCPDDVVLSEETVDDPRRAAHDRVWIIDPLDGRTQYADGRPDWAVDVALWAEGGLRAGAVALPGLGLVLSTVSGTFPYRADGKMRIAVSRSRPPALAAPVARMCAARLVPMGSAGYKAAAVIRGEVDAYLHAGGQFEWDSAAPVAVARSLGLHTSRIDGSPLRYNQPNPWLPDLLICRPELADQLLDAIAASTVRGPHEC